MTKPPLRPTGLQLNAPTTKELPPTNRLILTLTAFLLSTNLVSAQVVRQRDIIYLRTEGVAMTMDVFVPENPNGIGIIKIVSGGWDNKQADEVQFLNWFDRYLLK